jgi:hypothetical protein
VHPLIHCVAAPWGGLGAPASISVIGHADDVAHNAALVDAVLRVTVSPGATRDRIVLSAAEVAGARA